MSHLNTDIYKKILVTPIIDAHILYYNYQGGVNTTNGFELVDFSAIFLQLAGVCSTWVAVMSLATELE